MTINPKLIEALAPIIERANPSTHWLRRPGDLPVNTRKPLAKANLKHHLNGGPYVGVGLIRPGESVTMMAVLDLDSHKGETPWPEMLDVAARVMAALDARGLAPIAFRSSGGHGLHLYLLWEQPQDAYSVRTLLREALAECGFKDGTAGVSRGQIEVYPRQNSVAEGKFGNMVVAPLAGASVPLCPLTLNDLPKDAAIGMDWPLSAAVPVLERPVVERPTTDMVSADLAVLRSALAAIPNEGAAALDYDTWRNVVFAIHHATGGSDEGLTLAHEFSARSEKYGPDFLDERVWPYIETDHDSEHGAITAGTIFKLAREAGWREPVEHEFEALPVVADGGGHAPELPRFERNKAGEILATISNIQAALERADLCGGLIRFDTFRDEIMLSEDGGENWRPYEDADYVRMRRALELGGFKPIGKELMRDVVLLVASENKFDTAQLWLSRLEWDGVPRVERFLSTYFGAEDDEYTRGVSRYIWTALAGRVVNPGCKADMVPILVGAQGIRKSSSVAAMVPSPDFFAEIDFAEKDADLSRKMRGCLVGEIGELRGLNSKDLESIKAFITRTHEKWVPKFREFTTTFPRRLLFIGTTNQEQFLADETGNRRWLPVRVVRADRDGVARDAAQLWAEGAVLHARHGVQWHVEALADDAHTDHTIRDPWEDLVADWLAEPDLGDEQMTDMSGRRAVRVVDALRRAVGMDARQITKREEMRMARVLTALGWTRTTLRVGGRPSKVWVNA
jgi:predicted P-loop ATPase